MELNVFIQEFLPDYYNSLWSAIHNEGITESDFERQNFPEALKNFTDKICEAQRRMCNITAEQPKIDYLLTKK